MLWVWENCYKKWWYLLPRGIKGDEDEFKLKVKTIKAKAPDDLEKDEKELLEALHTPYTNAASGQKRFGGWTEEGWRRFKVVRREIKKNRDERKDEIKVIEDRVLEAVRAKNGRDAIDARRAGRGARRVVAQPEPEVEEEDSDDDQF